MLLSAAMIVKDEERFLDGCLASLAGVVDEVVVVDTGSTDATVAIAERHGCRVVHHIWQHDFSAARNVSLDAAAGDWILYIDADERLEGVVRSDVEALLSGAQEMAFRILLRPRIDSTPYREYRLWRNDPRVRFEGVIHEKVVPAIHRVADLEGRRIGTADWMLAHLGYEDNQARKHHRNLPLLRRQLEIEPDNLFAWHHLARVLYGLGRSAEAEEVLVRGLQISRRLGRADPVAGLNYGELIQRRMAVGRPAADLTAEARRLFPDNCAIAWLDASQRMAAGDFRGALEALQVILGVDWTAPPGSGPAYDKALVGELPWSAKALCHFRLQEYEEAAEAYGRAARCNPADPSYPVKQKLAAARAGAGTERLPVGAVATR